LDLQPEYVFALWVLGVSQSCLGLSQEAVETLERVNVKSRAPIYVGLLGAAYARAGRTEDAQRLLEELEDRGSRGEFVSATSRLSIYAGMSDIPAMRRELALAVTESVPAFSLRITCAFVNEFRADPEIDRMLTELYGY